MHTRLSYRNLIEERRAWYKTVKNIYCPCLKIIVIFNSKGFYHLRYNSAGKERSINEQVERLTLLPFSLGIIQKASKIYRYRKINNIEYWSLQEIIDDNKALVRVILKKTNSRQLIFHSIFEKKNKKTVIL